MLSLKLFYFLPVSFLLFIFFRPRFGEMRWVSDALFVQNKLGGNVSAE